MRQSSDSMPQRLERGKICQGNRPLTVQAGESSPRVAMTSSTFFMASGTASASTSLRLLLHSYMTCLQS